MAAEQPLSVKHPYSYEDIVGLAYCGLTHLQPRLTERTRVLPLSSSTPRVLVIAHQYWPVPGPATLRLGKFVEQLTKAFGKTEVTVLTTRDPSSMVRASAAIHGQHGEQIRRLATSDATGQQFTRIRLILQFSFEALFRGLRLGPIDVVVADPPPFSGLAAILCARWHRATSVYYFCDSWAFVAQRGGLAGRLYLLIKFAEDACLRRADIVLAAEPVLKSEAEARGAKKVILAQNGADLDLISSLDKRKLEPAKPSKPYFIYAGTHSEVHGARIFVEAARLLWASGADFELHFVGGGTDASWIKREVEREDCHSGLTHRSAVPLAELIPLLTCATASLVSLGDVPEDYYATPSKIYTSVATGCPVIYAGVQKPVAFIEDEGLGWVVPRDPTQVAQAMSDCLQMAKHSELHFSEIGDRCRSYAMQHRDFGANLHKAVIDIRKHIETQV